MPAFKSLKESSSKSSPEDSPGASSDPTTKTLAKEIPPETPTIADPDVPQYSDVMKEAWRAANVELPEARGVEKFLNRVGGLFVQLYAVIVY
jgi:hypothetical protein